MDGWIGGGMDGWMDGWMDGTMDGWMDVIEKVLHIGPIWKLYSPSLAWHVERLPRH